MKINEIERILKSLSMNELENYLPKLKEDERPGVIKLYNKYANKVDRYLAERDEWILKQDFDEVFHHNHLVLAGVDEVGRGPLAGPVVAAAVILPYRCDLVGVKDSKKLSELKREELFLKIQEVALGIGIGIVDSYTIDQVNILKATFLAMQEALSQLPRDYEILCVDGDKCIPEIEKVQHAIISGDNKSASIAAASIVAKVTRDRMMKEYALLYPQYGWESNKGYGSEMHYEAIRKYGITPLHRKTFLKNEGIF